MIKLVIKYELKQPVTNKEYMLKTLRIKKQNNTKIHEMIYNTNNSYSDT